jgi:CheY-like chemotaxis protein
MKKILTSNDLYRRYLKNETLIDRADIAVFTAETSDEMVEIHRKEKADLILTGLDPAGTRIERLFDTIRENKDLRKVSTIIICEDNVIHRARCEKCGPNACLAMPVDKAELKAKTLQLLDIAPRRPYRVTLNVAVEGKFNNKPFLHRTEDISSTGMLIRAKDILAQGDHITFSFYLPSGMRISARGEVERIVKQTAEPGICLYGVKFTDLESSARSAIEAFVTKELNNRNLP